MVVSCNAQCKLFHWLPPLNLSLSSRHASSSKSPRTPSPLRMTQHSNLYSTGSPSSGMLSLPSPLTPLLTTQMRKGGTLPSINTNWECDGEALLESAFPERELTVFVGTWNMQEHKVRRTPVNKISDNRYPLYRYRKYSSSLLQTSICLV